MPYQKRAFVNGEYYHIFNKTIDKKTPFQNGGNCALFSEVAEYYRASNLQVSYSKWKKISGMRKEQITDFIHDKSNFKVSVAAYCLMPNHFHFLLKQKKNNGIDEFVSNLINSYTRSYNIMNERKGQLFLSRYHSVAIKSYEQLLTVSRYIHLNPLAGRIVNSIEELREYRWSSYQDYLEHYRKSLTEIDDLYKFFEGNRLALQSFVESERDRLRTLSYIQDNWINSTTSEVQPRGLTPEVV